ncbi:MAG: hypothetical protein GY702_08155 [Desulfobulbaceae bacterium]|nr:hypothetical protein [Desulfobulbaceae bacterium]
MASLARLKPGKSTVAERFELYIGGVETANGFSELTDSHEQRRRFTREIAESKARYGNNLRMPEKFLEDLHTIDTAAGIALGVDRLLMMLLGKDNIADTATFGPDDM